MAQKPTYDELEQRIQELEKERVEYKKMDDRLNNNEIKFQDLANSIDDIFFALDNELNYTFWNKACSHMFGMSSEIMIGKSFFDFEFNKGYEWIADIYKEVIYHRQSRNFESSISLGDKKNWYEIKASPSSSGCAVLLKDITERKQAEKSWQKAHNELEKKVRQQTNELYDKLQERKRTEYALSESEGNFRELIETIEDIILVGNLDGSIIYSNAATSSKLGYNPKELCKLKILDLHPPYLRKEAAFIVSEMISGNQDVCPLPVLGKNGNLIPVETRVWIGKWNGTDCIFGISKDLSKEQEALQKFDQIFRMNPALMAVSKMPDRTFTDVNDAFLQTLGYSKEEIIGKSSLELNLFINKEEQNQVSQMLSDYGHFREIEMQVRTKQGGVRYGLFSGDTIETHGTKYLLTVMVDITKKKQAEAERKLIESALVDQKQRLSYILEGTNVGTWEWDVQTGETIFNERWANIIGYTLEEISPTSIETWMKFTHPDDLEVSNELLKKHFSNELDFYECEARMKHKDGTWVWVSDRGRVISRAKNGKPLIMMGTHQDITKRKQTELELYYNKFQLDAVFDNINVSIYIADMDSHEMLYMNSHMIKIFGKNFTGKVCWKSIHSNQSGPCDFCTNDKLIDSDGNPNKPYVWETYNEQLNQWYELRDQAIPWTDGRLVRMEMATDITERKKMEEALLENESKYREFVDGTEDLVIRLDNKGNFVFLNHTAEKVFGIKSDGSAGLSVFDFVHPNDKEKINLAFVEWGEKKLRSHIFENRMIDFTGKTRHMTWSINIHYETDGAVKHINCIAKDITVIKQIQKDLLKAKNKAESANKAKSEFLANMSHEIRTPLNAVNGFSELLMTLVADKKQKNYLESIQTAGKSLLSLINDILDLSKIEAGKMQIQYTPVNIQVIFDEIKQIFITLITDKFIEFSIDFDKNVPHLLILDETRIRQILLNIVGNAIKFTKEGYIKLMVKQTGSKKNKRKIDLEISVKDTGIGIAKTDQDKIFNIFEQQDGQSTRTFGGTGLGLSISKRLAKMMNGQIMVASEVNEGSTFTILLRDVEVSTVKAATAAEEINDTDNMLFDKAKILVVDDVRSNREFLSELLGQTNLNVRTAKNGQEAILFAKEYQPDVIIMDIKMPVLDGFDAAKHLKKNPETKQIPIVISSAVPIIEYEKKLSKIGIDSFLSKPVTKNMLFNELAKLIGYTTKNITDVIQPNHDYSLIDIKNSPELVKALKKDILPFCESLENVGVMNDIKIFSNRIKELGQNFNVKILIKYGEGINESAQNYDLPNIQTALKTIATMIKQLN